MKYHQVAFHRGWCSGFRNQLRTERTKIRIGLGTCLPSYPLGRGGWRTEFESSMGYIANYRPACATYLGEILD